MIRYVQRQYIHVHSRTISYFDSSPGDRAARVLLLAHAFPLGGAMWEGQAKALPAGWRLLAPDMRGFGGSTLPDPDPNPSIDDYADDVIDLLRELGVEAPVLGGLSMGGYVTFAVLRRIPGLARAVILADTRAGADSPEGRANRRGMLALVDREGPSGVARDMMPKLLGPTSRDSRPDVEPLVRRLIKQQSPLAIRGAVLRMMERPDSFATLQAIAVPALILVGQEDSLTPVDDSRKMHAMQPNAELVELPAAGHLTNLETPVAFNAALSAFLGRV
jgi:pimeloyl-ACP methyl ester carboxylesterase